MLHHVSWYKTPIISIICHLFFDTLNLQSLQFSMYQKNGDWWWLLVINGWLMWVKHLKAPIFQPWQVVATWPWPHRRGSEIWWVTLHWPGLVNLQKTMENHHWNSGFSHEKWWIYPFKIAKLGFTYLQFHYGFCWWYIELVNGLINQLITGGTFFDDIRG